jgi:uncharacterized protein (DUF433 family)
MIATMRERQGRAFVPSATTSIIFKAKFLGTDPSEMEKFDRIAIDVARMSGEPCIRNLRLTVRPVLEGLAIYPDRAELKREDEDIRQALVFAAALVEDKLLPLLQPR